MDFRSSARHLISPLSILMLAACGGASAPGEPDPPLPDGFYTGDRFDAALAAPGGQTCGRVSDADRARDITVQLRVPQAPSTPRPVIVFSHGGGPREPCSFGNAEWGRSLAEAGYIVVHVAHSLRSADQDRACVAISVPQCSAEEAMRYHRPLDIQTVLAALPSLLQDFQIASVSDPGRIAVAGHSFGAFTAMAVAGARYDLGALRDINRRVSTVRSVLALSPQGPDRFGWYDRGTDDGNSWDAVEIPVMTQTGAADITNGEDAASRRVPFLRMPPPDKAELFIDDNRAQHETFNLNDSSAPEPLLEAIRSTAIAFFDATLQERPDAWRYLASSRVTAASDGVATLSRRELAAPSGP